MKHKPARLLLALSLRRVAFGLCLLLIPALAAAQSGGTFELSRGTPYDGGPAATGSGSGADFWLADIIGQPEAAAAATGAGLGGDFTVRGGFQPVPLYHTVYVDDAWTGQPAGAYLGDGKRMRSNAFADLAPALSRIASGGSVIVAPGAYADNLFLDRPVTVTLTGQTTLTGSISITQGSLVAPAVGLELHGDFTRAGVELAANGGTILFDGGIAQYLALNALTTFENLTVVTPTLLIETIPDANAYVQGTLTNTGVIRKTQPAEAEGEILLRPGRQPQRRGPDHRRNLRWLAAQHHSRPL
jgi:hypothetical protein